MQLVYCSKHFTVGLHFLFCNFSQKNKESQDVLGTSQTFVVLSARDKVFFSSDANLLCFDFFDRKYCQLICKVFTLFNFFFWTNFSSFFVLELCSFSPGKNVTQGIFCCIRYFRASFSCLQNYHHVT